MTISFIYLSLDEDLFLCEWLVDRQKASVHSLDQHIISIQ